MAGQKSRCHPQGQPGGLTASFLPGRDETQGSTHSQGRGAPWGLQGRSKPDSAHRLLRAAAALCLVRDARLEDGRKGGKGSAGYPFPGLWLGREGFSLDHLWSVLTGTAGLWASPVPRLGIHGREEKSQSQAPGNLLRGSWGWPACFSPLSESSHS